MPDITALGLYAEYLNEDVKFGGERVARIMFRVFEGLVSSKPIQQHLHDGKYEDIVKHWVWVKYWALGVCRVVCYPIAAVLFPVNTLKIMAEVVLSIFK
jgi:hypothetical protein